MNSQNANMAAKNLLHSAQSLSLQLSPITPRFFIPNNTTIITPTHITNLQKAFSDIDFKEFSKYSQYIQTLEERKWDLSKNIHKKEHDVDIITNTVSFIENVRMIQNTKDIPYAHAETLYQVQNKQYDIRYSLLLILKEINDEENAIGHELAHIKLDTQFCKHFPMHNPININKTQEKWNQGHESFAYAEQIRTAKTEMQKAEAITMLLEAQNRLNTRTFHVYKSAWESVMNVLSSQEIQDIEQYKNIRLISEKAKNALYNDAIVCLQTVLEEF